MGSTKIEWADKVWNPLTGCTKVSPGCDHCYAKTMHERFNGPGSFDTVTLHPERLSQPLRWRKPSMVFVNSMSDLFHQDVPDEYIADVFVSMALATKHTFQLLTKRHARVRSLLSDDNFVRSVGEKWLFHPDRVTYTDYPGWPLPNVWLGVSVENQQWADIRIPALLDTPAAVRFLSCEPLLGPVDLSGWLRILIDDLRFHWVIVGGESGPGARPMHPDWARTIRDQCDAAGVPFLFKQWGAWAPGMLDLRRAVGIDRNGHALPDFNVDESQGHTIVTRVGKKAAGRELDGPDVGRVPRRSTEALRMNTATLPDVDERTRHELQPPCEARQVCDRAAAWIARFQSTCDHVPTVALCCTRHAEVIAAKALRGVARRVCSVPVTVTGIERL